MKKSIRILSIFMATIFILGTVAFSQYSAKNASAVNGVTSADELNLIKDNILYKSIYNNIKKCYTNMQPNIEQTEDAVMTSFDSETKDTYFYKSALAKDFLKFPWGVNEKSSTYKNKASCPGMITGWNTNWFVNLFTKTGSYQGLLAINKDAKVPGGDYSLNQADDMDKFLTAVGYSKTEKSDGTYDGKNCFYLTMTINPEVYANGLPTPSRGGTSATFETVDYCTTSDSNGKVNSISYLTGNNYMFGDGYDNGHLTDYSNMVLFQFEDGGYSPLWMKLTGCKKSFCNKSFIQANLFYAGGVKFRYLRKSETTNEETREAKELSPKTIDSHKRAESAQTCGELGFYQCAWYWPYSGRIYDYHIGSLTYYDTPITHNEFISRFINMVDRIKDDYDGYYYFSNVKSVNVTPKIISYQKNGSDYSKILKYFIKDTSKYNDGVFTEGEKYVLYYTYLTENYTTYTSETEKDGSILVPWLDKTDYTFKQRYIYNPDTTNAAKTNYVLSPSTGTWSATTTGDWEYIAKQLALIDVKTAFDAEVEDIVDPDLDIDWGESDDTSDVTDGSDDVNCYTAGGSLGWVLCPILNFLTETVNSIYDSVVEPYLRMDVALLNPNDDAGKATLEGWKTFQGIANILLVIFFIVIIASQLTGIGISNYGIKKSLPKIIVAAVLINLSFIICQLAVDASNIVGSSVKALFDSMGKEIAISSIKYGEAADPVPVNTTGMNIVAGAVGILATLVFGAAALYIYGAAILIPLIVGALSVFISIFFVFILLSIRKAAVIILTAISPLAFAMYMLPNTKRLFDKWLKAFEGLLLLYPIAGALIGGGNFASRLLLMSGTGEYDFFFALSAMIIGIVPIFFIPSLLKHSFAAMGNIGAKISGIGAGASRRAGRSVRDSQWARGLNEDQMRTMARRRSGLKADGTLSMRGKAQNKRLELADKARSKNKVLGGIAGVALGASAGSQRRLNNMRANTLENIAKDGNNEYIGEGSEDAIANRKAAADAEREAREVKDIETSIVNSGDGNNEKKLQDNLTDAIRTGDAKKIKAYQNVLSRKGESGREAVRQAMIEAEKTGDVSAESRKIYSNNIIDNWSKDYKDNARSTYDYAMANTSGAGESMANYEAKSAEKITQNQMAQMDETELQRYIDNMKSGKLSQSDAVALYETASGACSNKDIIASTKASQRAKMQQLMHIYEATRPHKSNSNPDGSNENNNGSSAGANANESNNSSNPNGSSTQSEAKPNGNT